MLLESYYQIIDCTLIGRDQVFEIASDGSFQPRQSMLDALCLKKEEFLAILYYDYFSQDLDHDLVEASLWNEKKNAVNLQLGLLNNFRL